ncbi:MAG: cation:proton antiporter [Pseudomonadota bacterium]|nr:cation:proton antiporter [Pseudomonadota bacterium]
MPLSEIILVVMGLLAVSMMAAAVCSYIPIPYTVFLVILGMFLGSLARQNTELNFLLDFQLSPDLVLYLFLPVLVFESAINLDARSLIKDIVPILVLAIPALVISTAIIGLGLWFIEDFNIIYALIFGALISATDPVAVISLFKELGAPHRLTILVEGESLLNDATAIVLFNILLGISIWEQFGVFDFYVAIAEFFKVFFGGLSIGIIIGIITSEILHRIHANISAYLIMSIVVAYSSFAISEHLMHVSGVMAVVSSAITLGLLGVSRIPQRERETVDETWDVLALVCNSLLFLLVGLSVDVSLLFSHVDTIFIAIILVLIARAAGVYTLVPATVKIFNLPKVSMNERHIMWWGALKGGLAIAIVLSIPSEIPGRETLIYVTLGVVLFSLLINASTVRPLMHKLGFDQFTDEEEVELQQGLKQSLSHTEDVLEAFKRANIIPRSTTKLIQERTKKIFESGGTESDKYIKTRYVRVTALRMEMKELKDLYDIGFLQYYTYMNMRILLQRERDALASNLSDEERNDVKIKQNPFLKFESAVIKRLREHDFASGILSRYQYIRFSQTLQRNIAGLLICRKIIRNINNLDGIDSEIKEIVVSGYKERRNRRKARLDNIAENFPDFYSRFETRLFEKVSLNAADFFIREAYNNRELGAKVFVNIKERIAEAIDELPQITDSIPILQPRDIIAMVPLFEGLSEKLLDQLSDRAKLLTFLQGDLIIGQNEKGDSLYIINHGEVMIYKAEQEDEPNAEVITGDYIGEMA